MEKYYCFAGIELAVRIPEGKYFQEDKNLAIFSVNSVQNPHRICFEMVDSLPHPEGVCLAAGSGFRVYSQNGTTVRFVGTTQTTWESAYMRVEHSGMNHRVQLLSSQYPEKIGTKTLMNCIGAEHLVVDAGGYIFHSACIERQGAAILFTAPSGTGKSTQAELWQRHRGAQIINGDRIAIRVMENGVFASGIPFSGSSGICVNKTLPLQSIVYLKQADHSDVRRLRGAEAFQRVWEGCSINTWDRCDVDRISELVRQTVLSVPIYELSCTPDETALKALECTCV